MSLLVMGYQRWSMGISEWTLRLALLSLISFYRREYHIELEALPAKVFFEYGAQDLCSIEVRKITRKKREALPRKEQEAHTERDLGPPKKYTLHLGYHRVLAGFLQEIKFMEEDKLKSYNCLFRGTYLSKILDIFVEELSRIPENSPWCFRSRALNPLLQRQLRGIHDDYPMQVKMEVGESRADVGKFYLELDPLAPALINKLMRNILYIWQVRLSLGFLLADVPAENQNMTSAIHKTKNLLVCRSRTYDAEWDRRLLMKYEVSMIQEENLGVYYSPLLKVSELVFFLGRSCASLPT